MDAAAQSVMDKMLLAAELTATNMELMLEQVRDCKARIEALESDRDKMRRELLIQDRMLTEIRRERWRGDRPEAVGGRSLIHRPSPRAPMDTRRPPRAFSSFPGRWGVMPRRLYEDRT